MKKENLEIVDWVIKKSLQAGADEAAASVTKSRGVELDFRDHKPEKLQESTENSLWLEIFVNKKYSGQSTNDLRKESLEKFISEAVVSTKYLTEDEFRKLPDPKYYPQKMEDNLNLYDDHFDKIETSERKTIAAEIEQAALKVSDQIISVTSGYYDNTYESAKMHSNGFTGESYGTIFSAGATVTVKDQEAGRPEDWCYVTTRFYNELPALEMLGKNAAERALRKIGQQKIKSGKYMMLVENRSADRVLSVFQGAMTAQAIQQKASFLEGMIGKKIASDKLTVIDDPFIAKGLGSRIYDNEGLAAKKRVMIDKGILQQYYVDNYYGKKLGMEPTTGYPSNVMFEYGDKSFEEITKEMKNGIIVNGFIGGNSNSTTGDFSFGIVGLLVENGEIIKAINEMNISGNAKEFFNQLVAMGNDPYPYSSVRVPCMLFENVNFSGI